ncbi:MAG: electron transport complex subunit RsxE [Sedimentisphaerales bacterium]|nr:electron transport complex subunit RsxE [Sedimentisphaerales bacterium]
MQDNTSDNLYTKVILNGLWRQNPALRLLIGMCPPLAVTTGVRPALTMGLSVIFVLSCSNLVVSLIRPFLRPHVRIIVFTITIATFVTICDLLLKAYLPAMSEVLGPYVPLIIVNCLIIFRAEACASKSPVLLSVIDALGMGGGFTVALLILASIREVLATGCWAGWQVMPKAFVPWLAMQMPVGAFVTLGLLLGLIAMVSGSKEARHG